MESINTYTATGNVCADPDMRSTKSGFSILTFRVAVNNAKKVGDEWQDIPFYITCKAFGRKADGLGKLIHKGSFVTITGSLWSSEWEKDGVTRRETECHLDKCIVKNRETNKEPMEVAGIQFYDEDVPF